MCARRNFSHWNRLAALDSRQLKFPRLTHIQQPNRVRLTKLCFQFFRSNFKIHGGNTFVFPVTERNSARPCSGYIPIYERSAVHRSHHPESARNLSRRPRRHGLNMRPNRHPKPQRKVGHQDRKQQPLSKAACLVNQDDQEHHPNRVRQNRPDVVRPSILLTSNSRETQPRQIQATQGTRQRPKSGPTQQVWRARRIRFVPATFVMCSQSFQTSSQCSSQLHQPAYRIVFLKPIDRSGHLVSCSLPSRSASSEYSPSGGQYLTSRRSPEAATAASARPQSIHSSPSHT